MNRLLQLLLLLFLVALSGCLKGDKKGECVYQGDCTDQQACIEGQCQDVSCTASSDCEMHQFCNKKFDCQDGCNTADDCQAGEICGKESHQCYAYGCRDTQLDCEIGQYCEPTTEECYDDPKPNCSSCDAASANSCGGGGDCFIFETGSTCSNDTQCPSGWYCDSVDLGSKVCHQDFCLMPCSPASAEPCPRGYQCGDITSAGDYYCFADCAWLNENQ